MNVKLLLFTQHTLKHFINNKINNNNLSFKIFITYLISYSNTQYIHTHTYIFVRTFIRTYMQQIGVVAYTLLSGYEPFYGNNDSELITANKTVNYEFHLPEWSAIR